MLLVGRHPSIGEIQPFISESNEYEECSQYSTFEEIDGDSNEQSSGFFRRGFFTELWSFFNLNWPLVVTHITHMMIGPTSVMFVGHLNSIDMLNAMGLAISMINGSTIAVSHSMGSACKTVFANCKGIEKKNERSYLVQKAMILSMLVAIIIISIHINFVFILTKIGQYAAISGLVGDYLLIFIPGSLSYFGYVVLLKYLHSQDVVIPNMIIGLLVNIVNAGLHYLFVFYFKWNVIGSAISMSISYILFFTLTSIYIYLSGIFKDTWNGWSWKCLEKWSDFCKLAFTGMLVIGQEYWALEIIIFISGLLSSIDLSAQIILIQIGYMWFPINHGLQLASSIKLEQYLGESRIKSLLTIVNLTLVITGFISMISAVTFILIRNWLPLAFTNLIEVIDLTTSIFPIFVIFVMLDTLVKVAKGILLVAGKQLLVVSSSLLFHYCLVLPIGFSLMFYTHFHSAAIWIALIVNSFVQFFLFLTFIIKTDWKIQCLRLQIKSGLSISYNGHYTEEIDETRKLLCGRIFIFFLAIFILVASVLLSYLF